MVASVFVTLAALTLSGPGPWAGGRARAHAAHVRRVERGPRRRLEEPASELYSLRARRRAVSYIRLRLLEMREEGLERAAAVVEGRLPLSTLEPGR